VGVARRIRTPHRPQHPRHPEHSSDRPERIKAIKGIKGIKGIEDAKRTDPSTASRTSSALEALLVDLGSQVHRGISQETAETLRFCPTGLDELDAHLGGGFPVGRLSEICGAPSSGRTSLALALLTETLSRGVFAAWVDRADAFDPISATLAGSDLENLLWVRARSDDEALRSCDRLLQTEGFELVILDLATLPSLSPIHPLSPLSTHSAKNTQTILPTTLRTTRSRSPKGGAEIRVANWLRLARLASSARSAFVVISNTSVTGSQAELILEMKPLAAHFVGPPKLLEALETTAVLQRHRSRPTGQEIPFRVHADDPPPDPPPSTRTTHTRHTRHIKHTTSRVR